MSFVLEALKKREAEGDADAAVSLARAAARSRRNRVWAALFVAAMTANAGLLAWLLVPHWPAPGGEEPVGGEPPAEASPAAADRPPRVPEPEIAESAPPARPAAAEPQRVTLGELPEEARARFPGIAFSTHVYSKDPELRAVVANGTRLEEGDRVRGLRIHEITAAGVVLRFEDYLVEVRLALDWDAT
ncbi:MAG: general secretion pathway protein GspB [Pseudomonadota bacterium]